MNIRIFKQAEASPSRKRFYFTTERQAAKYGYNITVRVYTLRKDGSPCNLGFVEANTASFPGEYALAVALISEVFGYRNNTYDFTRKDIQLYQIG